MDRQSSTSSDEATAKAAPIHWRSEASVLTSVSKTVPTDDWPIFQLRDAIVLNRDGTTVENALHTVTNGPYIVRGYLHYTAEEKKRYLIIRERSPIPIEIRHCVLYSVGEAEDSMPQIWVSGRAGWFEIAPCPAYDATFVTMCEATTLYFSIMDTIIEMSESKKPIKKSKSKSKSSLPVLGSVFHKYAATVGDGSTYQDVVARCDAHAIFLFSQFHQDDGSMNWKSTEFYSWLKARNLKTFEKVETARQNPRQRTRSPSIIEPPPRTRNATADRSASIEEIEKSVFQCSLRPTRATRSNSAAAQPTVVPLHPRKSQQQSASSIPRQNSPPLPSSTVSTHSSYQSPFDSVLTALEDSFNYLHPSKSGVKVSALLNRLYFNYRFPTYKSSIVGSHKQPVREVLHYNAAKLITAIDAQKYKHGEIYDWLQDLASEEFAPVAMNRSSFPFRIFSREQRPFQSRRPDAKVESMRATGPSELRTPSPVTPRVGKRPGRPVGSKSSLRPIQSTRKRSRAGFGGDEDGSETDSVAKKMCTEPDADGDQAMADAQSSADEQMDDDDDDDDGEHSDASSGGEAVDHEGKPAKLSILAEKLPDPMPTGHHGTWVCEQPECEFIARGGDEDELDDRISAHLKEHEQRVDRLQLAMTESRGLLPINHLLEKLKQVGEERSQGLVATDSVVAPRPIKRTLFV